jgi:SWIM zinc finger
MPILLASFEMHIDETILEWGLRYFQQDAVGEVEELAPGEYEGEVLGSEPYTVRIAVKKGEVAEHDCTCPYEGTVCKHVVAMLFHLQRDELDIQVKRKRKKKEGTGVTEKVHAKKKPKTVTEKVADLLDRMPHEELKEFILEHCQRDKVFRQVFAALHEERTGGATYASYTKQIKAFIRIAGGGGRNGGWYAGRNVRHALEPLLAKLRTWIARNDHALALPLATALLHELNDALGHIDDSNGELGGGISEAVDALHGIAKAPVDEAVRKALLAFALNAAEKKHYHGWDWHTDVMSIATELVRDDKEAALVSVMLRGDHRDGYHADNARNFELSLVERFQGTVAAEEFIHANLRYHDIRERAINMAIERKDLDRAKALADEGEAQDRVQKPGLADTWRAYQLRIAQERNDTTTIIRIARIRLFDREDIEKNYDLLRRTVPPENWTSYNEALLADLGNWKNWRGKEAFATLLKLNGRWPELMALCARRENSGLFNEHVADLSRHVPNEVAAVHLEHAEALVTLGYAKRDSYIQACLLLKKVHALGCTERADAKVAEWRRLYPKRPSLMEELDRL